MRTKRISIHEHEHYDHDFLAISFTKIIIGMILFGMYLVMTQIFIACLTIRRFLVQTTKN